MPLASTFGLQWYGPAMAAAVIVQSADITASAKTYGRAGATLTGAATTPLAKATILLSRPATLTGTGSVAQALPKGRLRASATIKVNQLTQDDVTGAVLEAEVSPGLTLKQALIDARKAAKLAAALSA
jgi:hypothetical protein